MNFRNIVIMMSKFGSKSGDFAQRGEFYKFETENVVQHGNTSLKFKKLFINKKTF